MELNVSHFIECSLCSNYKLGKCNSDLVEIVNTYNKVGKQYARECTEFTNERIPIIFELEHPVALKFILAGVSEFILISGKTGTNFRYKLDKKVSTVNNKTDFIYWLSVANKNGETVYAGVLFLDINSNSFKFGKGARGNVASNDIRVKSILFVLNSLKDKRYDINVAILHVGKCGMCGKRLTDTNSILIGLGPVCAKASITPDK